MPNLGLRRMVTVVGDTAIREADVARARVILGAVTGSRRPLPRVDDWTADKIVGGDGLR